ncbi:MAG: hypothetical protein M3T96_04530 [Acidobacteriota bacterium]|nr:hypothetical protein [Acidobacteriota bacterium]
MRKQSISAMLFLIVSFLGIQTATAQFNIKIPKVGKPKIEQPKIEQPTTQSPVETSTSGNDNASASSKPAATEPTILKDWVQIRPATNDNYRGNRDLWSWYPMMSFSIHGPVGSGEQAYAEFNVPGAGVIKFDCPTNQKAADEWLNVKDCNSSENLSTTYTGVVGFAIKMRNELAGTDKTLFTGKVKILKVHSNEDQIPRNANHSVYYADHDWNMPIGYVFYEANASSVGMARPVVSIAFWLRGSWETIEPHLFYQGKEVGKKFYAGEEAGKPLCDTEVINDTTHYVADNVPQKAKWTRVFCTFNNVYVWNKTNETSNMFGDFYTLAQHPGEYEFKLLRDNHLARSIKFTAKSDGTFDNGIAAANNLGDERTIVQVQIIGDQDGIWDRTAWKTDAFYGNPLKGFVAP